MQQNLGLKTSIIHTPESFYICAFLLQKAGLLGQEWENKTNLHLEWTSRTAVASPLLSNDEACSQILSCEGPTLMISVGVFQMCWTSVVLQKGEKKICQSRVSTLHTA